MLRLTCWQAEPQPAASYFRSTPSSSLAPRAIATLEKQPSSRGSLSGSAVAIGREHCYYLVSYPPPEPPSF